MKEVLEKAKEVLDIEANAILNLKDVINKDFADIVDSIYKTKGRFFIGGIGKSGIIGRKIAATLSSTGTPSIFVHPTECFHGDMGVIVEGDIVMLMSYSGETEELIQIIPSLKRIGAKIIAMTGRKDSTLAKNSDFLLYTPIEKEACPMGIVPTASTTAMLAIGDALAVALIVRRGFSFDDFAKRHPGGSLGRKLITRVADIMYPSSKVPLVREDAKMEDIVIEITSKNFGITGVVDFDGNLVGAVTDADIRRHIKTSKTFMTDSVSSVMSKNPKIVDSLELASSALRTMEKYKITHLFVTDVEQYNKTGKIKVIGLLHIHSILEAKIY